MSGLNSYLKRLQPLLHQGASLFWVFGNQSADADSNISALVYAYFLSTHSGELHVPVLNIAASDMRQRNDTVFLLQQAEIAVSDLIFMDAIDLTAITNIKKKNIVLIDHNKPAPRQDFLSPSVYHIVDHHKDEQATNAEKKIIVPTGSCATLVAHEIFSFAPHLMERSVALLLLGVILLDTVNLSPTAQRSHALDCAMAQRLLAITKIDQNDYYHAVLNAKHNRLGISASELLSADYKEWHTPTCRYGISSIPLALSTYKNTYHNWDKAIVDFTATKNLDLFIIMHAFDNEGFKREMTVYSMSQTTARKLIAWLNTHSAGLSDCAVPGIAETKLLFFNQTNAGLSRKILQPVINDFFSS